MLATRAVRYLFRGPVGNLSVGRGVTGNRSGRPQLRLAFRRSLQFPNFKPLTSFAVPVAPLPCSSARSWSRGAYEVSDAGHEGCSLPLPRPQLEDRGVDWWRRDEGASREAEAASCLEPSQVSAVLVDNASYHGSLQD
jgi:hypothetical protein